MRAFDHRRRGSALVITVGLLAVLAVIGFGFAVMARLHHDLSRYYRASAQNDLIAHAAIHYALRDIREGWANAPLTPTGQPIPPGTFASFQTGAIAEVTDSPADPWYVDPSTSSQGFLVGSARHYCNLRCNSYAMVHDDLGDRIAISMVKVLDCAGKLNINDNYEDSRLQAVLSGLFGKLGIEASLAADILTYRKGLSTERVNQRFTSLDQLRARNPDRSFKIPGMSERTFEILKHYLTIYSWPHQLPTADGSPYVICPKAGDGLQRIETAGHNLRSPININTAAWELLYALLKDINTSTGISITPAEAENIAKWIVRRRDPENPDNWPSRTLDPTWKTWTDSASYDKALERKCQAWNNYAFGPFDSWGEVTDFLYSLVNTTAPFTATNPAGRPTLPDRAELVLAATCPTTFSNLAGWNTWSLSYFHPKQDPTDLTDAPDDPRQVLRDRDTSGNLEPQVTAKNQLAVGGDTHPFIFNSMGRFEIYSRTYTFAKADSGFVSAADANSLTDDTKNWTTSPPQWRGSSVLIYEGKGKGQLRGITYVDTYNGKGCKLYVEPWTVPLDSTADPNPPPPAVSTRSRYYILGPGGFLDRVDLDTNGNPKNKISVDAVNTEFLTDAEATWQDDEWNGHRIVVYKAGTSTGPSGERIETIDTASMQERTIIGTQQRTPKRLVLNPNLDANALSPGSDQHLGYIILGCDGMVEHQAAAKAYDVIFHSTQKDFETNKGTCVRAVTGPNACQAEGASAANASKIEGWVTCAKKEAAPSGSGGLLVNFKKANLVPDQGGSLASSSPAVAELVKDVFEDGRFLSDGLRLRGGSASYVAYTVGGGLVTSGPAPHEGGFVSVWFRPDEAFFSGTHTLVQIPGETLGEESISLVARPDGSNRVLELQVVANKSRVYLGTPPIADDKHPPGTQVKYKLGTRSHTDNRNVATWKPGEWHHIAFAWYECVNDDKIIPPGNPDWRDDEPPVPDNILDDGVFSRLGIWVDGGSPTTSDQPAFNFYPPADSTIGSVRLSGEAAGTLDCLVAYRTTGNEGRDLTMTVDANARRYDLLSGESKYESPPISIDAGGQKVTLGAVAWTGLMPWMPSGERWGGAGSAKYPIRIDAALDSDWSDAIPKTGSANEPSLGGGGALRKTSSALIESSSAATIKYRIYLLPEYGATTTPPGYFPKGNQAPAVSSVTLTYLGPIVFYYWR